MSNIETCQNKIDCVSRTIKLIPNNAEDFFKKGANLEKIPGKYQEAIDCYNMAIELNPRYALDFYNIEGFSSLFLKKKSKYMFLYCKKI